MPDPFSVKPVSLGALLCLLAACGASENVPNVTDSGETAQASAEITPRRIESTSPNSTPASDTPKQSHQSTERNPIRYWGVAEGEPLPIAWDELMPEGYLEDVVAQQQAYLEELQQSLLATATTLAEAARSESFDSIEEGSQLDFMPQFGGFEVVEDLDGELISIPGFVVPFDFSVKGRHTEFLFVPYMGACIHTPPPPPNQIIYVTSEKPVLVEDIWQPYTIEGTLIAEKNINDVGDAAYTLELDELEKYRE